MAAQTSPVTEFEYSNIRSLTRPGGASQGSQWRQTQGNIGPRRATITAARSRLWLSRATPGYGSDLIWEQEAAGSNPAIPTRSEHMSILARFAWEPSWEPCVDRLPLTGCRTEEARALTWDNVDLNGDPDAEPPVPPHVAVWRSVRSHGDMKTKKSRRTLHLPVAVVEALRIHCGTPLSRS